MRVKELNHYQKEEVHNGNKLMKLQLMDNSSISNTKYQFIMGMDLKVLLEISMQNMEKIRLKDNLKKLMI